MYRNKRLLEACRRLPCAICGVEDGTVVAAHSNQLADGKGKGIKAPDYAVAALCHLHHYQLDQGPQWTKQERKEIWDRAHIVTLRQLIERGILEVRK